MTNREIIAKAMPLYNLTNSQWEEINKLIEHTKEKVLLSAIKTLVTNQARIETMCVIFDCNNDLLDNIVREETTEQSVT